MVLGSESQPLTFHVTSLHLLTRTRLLGPVGQVTKSQQGARSWVLA